MLVQIQKIINVTFQITLEVVDLDVLLNSKSMMKDIPAKSMP